MKLLLSLLLLTILLVSCAPAAAPEATSAPEANANAEPVPSGTRDQPFRGHGFIREIRDDGVLIIEHEDIPGFMGAMTMGFPIVEGMVEDNALVVDDEINFEIEVLSEGYQIFNVERVDADSEEEGTPEGDDDSEPSPSN